MQRIHQRRKTRQMRYFFGFFLPMAFLFGLWGVNVVFGQAGSGVTSLGTFGSFSFEPLAKDEAFAYRVTNGHQLTLYARTKGSGDLREIGKWNNVLYWYGPINSVDGLEFSLDRKYCYFSMWNNGNSSQGPIYFVNGPEGIGTQIVAQTKSVFRSSSKGQYLIYRDQDHKSEVANDHFFILLDAFHAQKPLFLKWNIDDEGGFFAFMRVGITENFRILLVDEGFSIIATALVNPIAGTLNPEPITSSELNDSESFRDKKWRDSVSFENLDPNLCIGGVGAQNSSLP